MSQYAIIPSTIHTHKHTHAHHQKKKKRYRAIYAKVKIEKTPIFITCVVPRLQWAKKEKKNSDFGRLSL